MSWRADGSNVRQDITSNGTCCTPLAGAYASLARAPCHSGRPGCDLELKTCDPVCQPLLEQHLRLSCPTVQS